MTLYGSGIVVVGFVAMAIAVGLGSALMQRLSGQLPAQRGPEPATTAQLATDFMIGMAAAALGGLLVAALAPGARLMHTAALASLVLAMSIVCLIRPGDGVPRWYMAVLSLASALVIVAIGWMAG